MNDEWGFVFIQENCIQCHACEVACQSWRRVPPGLKWRRVINVWHGAYPNVTCSSASVACLHCVEPACVAACPAKAVSKRAAGGLVLVDAAKCTGCRACREACPWDVPQFGAGGTMQKCDLCGPGDHVLPEDPPCVSTCPTRALVRRRMTVAQKKETERSLATLYEVGNW